MTRAPAPPRDAAAILRARARALARPPEHASGSPSLDVLEFRLARESYAIETRHVSEVVPLSDLAPVPCTPAFVRGVLNVRGRVVPALDLQLFMQLATQGLRDLHHVVLVKGAGLEFGWLADAVAGVRSLPVEQLQPAPLAAGAEYLRGMTAERLLVLDFERVLADPRIVVNEEGSP